MPKKLNLLGQKYGRLTVIAEAPSQKGSGAWLCECDCGNIHYTTAELLLNGKTKSCGCVHSRGNQKIQQILSQLNLTFLKEYQVRINEINYYYDFAIVYNEKIICFIEYDGILHFEQDNYHGWNNQNNWERTQLNDKIKNQYCKDNNIKLIRIPYTDYDKLDITYIKERT